MNKPRRSAWAIAKSTIVRKKVVMRKLGLTLESAFPKLLLGSSHMALYLYCKCTLTILISWYVRSEIAIARGG